MTMGPELRRMNIERFQRLLGSASDDLTRAEIKRLIEDERKRPDAAYPRRPPPIATNSPKAG